LLWDKNYKTAVNHYKNLVAANPENFACILDYANTLTNLKRHREALEYIEMASRIKPEDTNAKTSKKYIQLAYADTKAKKGEFDEAQKTLTNNLVLFPNDRETLKAKANYYERVKKYKKAEELLKNLATSTSDSIKMYHKMTWLYHLRRKHKKAEKPSVLGFGMIQADIDSVLQKEMKEMHIRALIWNGSYKKAATLLSKETDTENTLWLLRLRAMLNSYKGALENALEDYEQILALSKESFEGNIGKTLTLKGLHNETKAYSAVLTTLEYHKNQKDALALKKSLEKQFSPYISSDFGKSNDSGKNTAAIYKVALEIPSSTKIRWRANYRNRSTQNTNTREKAITNNVTGGFHYKIALNFELQSNIGYSAVSSDVKKYIKLITQSEAHYQYQRRHHVRIGYSREMEDFNAALVNLEISKENLYANYATETIAGQGAFVQYYYTSLSDGNKRNLLFSSIYYSLLKLPLLKLGCN
jgi:tetratricopeptide (TPR) repeat protein